MRVVSELITPNADSYGNNHTKSEACPQRQTSDEAKLAVMEFIGRIGEVKPGTVITIKIEEDWT